MNKMSTREYNFVESQGSCDFTMSWCEGPPIETEACCSAAKPGQKFSINTKYLKFDVYKYLNLPNLKQFNKH